MKKSNLPVFIASLTLLCTSVAGAHSSLAQTQTTNDSPNSLAAPSQQTMTYDVYAGGIHAMQADLDIIIKDNNRYDLVLDAKTYGLLGKLAPWEGRFETHGWIIDDQHPRPEQHKSTSTWRGETQIKDYAYKKDGSFEHITIDEHDKPPYVSEIDPQIAARTVDALTATLIVLDDYVRNDQCKGTSLVFDGKRSFAQNFNFEDLVSLKSSKYNIYDGVAAQCTVEVVPKAGQWHKKPRGWMSIQEQGREKGMMPTVWIAQMEEGAPAVPVKIRVKTNYGTLFMHLVKYKGNNNLMQHVKQEITSSE